MNRFLVSGICSFQRPFCCILFFIFVCVHFFLQNTFFKSLIISFGLHIFGISLFYVYGNNFKKSETSMTEVIILSLNEFEIVSIEKYWPPYPLRIPVENLNTGEPLYFKYPFVCEISFVLTSIVKFGSYWLMNIQVSSAWTGNKEVNSRHGSKYRRT